MGSSRDRLVFTLDDSDSDSDGTLMEDEDSGDIIIEGNGNGMLRDLSQDFGRSTISLAAISSPLC